MATDTGGDCSSETVTATVTDTDATTTTTTDVTGSTAVTTTTTALTEATNNTSELTFTIESFDHTGFDDDLTDTLKAITTVESSRVSSDIIAQTATQKMDKISTRSAVSEMLSPMNSDSDDDSESSPISSRYSVLRGTGASVNLEDDPREARETLGIDDDEDDSLPPVSDVNDSSYDSEEEAAMDKKLTELRRASEVSDSAMAAATAVGRIGSGIAGNSHEQQFSDVSSGGMSRGSGSLSSSGQLSGVSSRGLNQQTDVAMTMIDPVTGMTTPTPGDLPTAGTPVYFTGAVDEYGQPIMAYAIAAGTPTTTAAATAADISPMHSAHASPIHAGMTEMHAGAPPPAFSPQHEMEVQRQLSSTSSKQGMHPMPVMPGAVQSLPNGSSIYDPNTGVVLLAHNMDLNEGGAYYGGRVAPDSPMLRPFFDEKDEIDSQTGRRRPQRSLTESSDAYLFLQQIGVTPKQVVAGIGLAAVAYVGYRVFSWLTSGDDLDEDVKPDTRVARRVIRPAILTAARRRTGG